MFYKQLLEKLKHVQKDYLVMYIPQYSDMLDTMIVKGELDIPILFDVGDLYVLTEEGFVNSETDIVPSPGDYDLIHKIEHLDIENGIMFYTQEKNN